MRHFKSTCKTVKRLILYLFIFAGLTGCASNPHHPRWLWPLPPDQPRFEFIRTFSSERDLLPNPSQKKLAALTGPHGQEEIYFPFGISAMAQNVILADQDKRSLRQYNLATGKVLFLAGPDQLKGPLDIELSTDGAIYLIDGNRLLKLSSQGELKILVAGDLLINPAYLAINPILHRIYISDSKANRIVVFSMSGDRLFTFGKTGKGKGEFLGPQGLAIDQRGQVFVADFFNARIQVFNPDGEYIRQFGQRGGGVADFEGPKDLAFDSEQHLHIIDSRKNALLSYSTSGELLLFTGGGPGTDHPLGFSSPVALYIDAADRFYISDRLNHRISIWQYLTPVYLKEHPITTQEIKQLLNFIDTH